MCSSDGRLNKISGNTDRVFDLGVYMKFSLRIFTLGCAAILLLLIAGCSQTPEINLVNSPNILLIISDDQRYDTMEYMPRTQELIFDQGVEFNSAYVTTARCCPSRASIFTGMYAHNHSVYTNRSSLNKTTIFQTLDRVGYYTGVVGKYLNSYPEDVSERPLEEFDVWNVYSGKSRGSPYFDLPLNINGNVETIEGYQTYILRDRAISFIEDASQRDEPFLLIFTPFAPHLPATPAPEDEGLYESLEPYRPLSFNEEEMADKPDWLASQPALDNKDIKKIDKWRQQQLESLNSLDLTVEDLVEELERQGELDNTIIIYMSDNGFFWGEHRLISGKIWAYEEASHVPFAIRYPAAIDQPFSSDSLVANIDIAPTILDILGLPIPDEMDGASLLPLLRGEDTEWRDYLLLEGWPINVKPVQSAPFFQAIHTNRYVYIETDGDKSELYDLLSDPLQLESQVDNPEYADIVADLKQKLEEERKTIPPVPASIINDTGDQGD
jgi:N-acetylglucosamine-6-sulfatase